MAVVSERPDILEKLFLSKVYDHYGVYEMRFFKKNLLNLYLVLY